MLLRNHRKRSAITMQVGMVFLILGSLARWFIHPSARMSDNLVDGVTGFLYGVAIASLLLSVILRGRGRSDRDLG